MEKKSKTIALILSILCGGLGIDRFYLGYIGMGVLKLLTAGVFGILYIIDIVRIATGSLQPADGRGYENDLNVSNAPKESAADELLKYKGLLDAQAITQEEFDKKKQELMSK